MAGFFDIVSIAGSLRTALHKRLSRYRTNEVLSASKMNRHIDATNSMLPGLNPPRQVSRRTGVYGKEFEIVSVHDDYLLCKPSLGGALVKVGKPYRLRRWPFDGQTTGPFTYTYSSATARESDNGADVEDQVVVPSYRVGDLIDAATGISGRRPMREDGNTGDLRVVWQVFDDSRVWAKVSA